MTYSPLHQLFASGLDTEKLSKLPCSNKALLGVLALCLVAFLDVSDVAFAFVGALSFLLFRSAPRTNRPSTTEHSLAGASSSLEQSSQKSLCESAEPPYAVARRERRERNATDFTRPQQKQLLRQNADDTTQKDTRQISVCPVVCPSFTNADWEGQINELLRDLAPSEETGALARNISCAVQDTLRRAFPTIDVVGYAHGNPRASKAFATAVPDIEIVANINREDMIKGMGASYVGFDSKCILKSAIRACTDQLAYGDFKFRRSAFKYDEPKVTLLAPVALESLPFDFSVNALTPMRHAGLLQGCFQVDTRAWELVLLVHRWARDRGISHAAKGHLTPYAWSLVAVFYLQVREKGEGTVMPAFQSSPPHFQQETKKSKKKAKSAPEATRTPASSLFKEFLSFYAHEFDWRREVISVKKASRIVLVPEQSVMEWRQRAVGLEICDPFEPTANLANLLSGEGRARLREELIRADAICSKDGLLSELLQPWTPADPAEITHKPASEAPGPAATPPWRTQTSSRGSLTASPMSLSFRPAGFTQPGASSTKVNKMSLTASPAGLQLKPSSLRRGSASDTDSTHAGTSTPAVSSDSD